MLPLSFSLKTKTSHPEGGVPAKSFYGAVDPAVSLRVLKAVPTLKSAFSQRNADEQAQHSHNLPSKKKKGTKTCTAHFGCGNPAAYHEDSGTLYCKLHKPKQVAVTPVLVEKQSTKKSKK